MNDQPNPQGRQALLQTIAQQQRLLNHQGLALEALRQGYVRQGLEIDYIARLAGVSQHIASIRTQADVNNPGQPVPDPPEQPAAETTEQAATPETYDSPLNPGQTPGSVQHLPADATGTPMDPGATLPTAPYNQLVEVTAPTQGTQPGEVPVEQVRTEVDVRVGDPMNLERAFPWTISPDAQGGSPESGEFAGGAKAASLGKAASQNRTMASLRLARLRIQAGIAESADDMAVQASIEADASLSDHDIESEIKTLSGVVQKAASRTQRPAGAVPRQAAVQRTTPSLVGQPAQGLSVEASVGNIEDCEDLFD